MAKFEEMENRDRQRDITSINSINSINSMNSMNRPSIPQSIPHSHNDLFSSNNTNTNTNIRGIRGGDIINLDSLVGASGDQSKYYKYNTYSIGKITRQYGNGYEYRK